MLTLVPPRQEGAHVQIETYHAVNQHVLPVVMTKATNLRRDPRLLQLQQQWRRYLQRRRWRQRLAGACGLQSDRRAFPELHVSLGGHMPGILPT